MVFLMLRRAAGTFSAQARKLHLSSSLCAKDYDKIVLLESENIKYEHNDPRFLRGPTPMDEPYVKLTEEEIAERLKVKTEKELSDDQITKVDPTSAPFNEVLQGYDDGGRFTGAEVIPDNATRWFWVDRLMPRVILDQPIREGSKLIPPLPEKLPNLPYFVARTRSRIYPIYRVYEVIGRDHKTYWRNRWDGLFNKYHTDILENLDEIKWENNEKTIVITQIKKIQGDVWKFEEDFRKYLENKYPNSDHILTAVNEVNGHVNFKGDFVEDCHEFLRNSGF